jgi:hypothetical protein
VALGAGVFVGAGVLDGVGETPGVEVSDGVAVAVAAAVAVAVAVGVTPSALATSIRPKDRPEIGSAVPVIWLLLFPSAINSAAIPATSADAGDVPLTVP